MYLRKIIYLILPFAHTYGEWDTSAITVGTSLMRRDDKIVDIQNFQGVVIDLKIWQSKVLSNTLIFFIPFTFSYFVDPNSDGDAAFFNAITLKAEAFTTPLKIDTKFAPFIQASFGPAVFGKYRLGSFHQGGNIGYQSTFGVGVYLTQKCSIQTYILHYCSAGLYQKNNGLTVPIVAGGMNF